MSRKDSILKIRQVLVQRHDALRRALNGDMTLLHHLRTQNTGDMIDAAQESVQDDISSQMVEVESRELTRVERALEKMREGTYGICEGVGDEECGVNIPMARLQALPYAALCINCQRKAERQGNGSAGNAHWWGMVGNPTDDERLTIADLTEPAAAYEDPEGIEVM